MRHAIFLLATSLTALPACSTPGSTTDGGSDVPVLDVPSADDAGTDAAELDAGTDAPPTVDTGVADAGRDAPRSGSCPPGLGEFCEDDGMCPSPYECDIGRCRPQGRPLCGGFAGATCDEPPYTACLYNDMADFGSCLTPAEVACICADPELSADVVCP